MNLILVPHFRFRNHWDFPFSLSQHPHGYNSCRSSTSTFSFHTQGDVKFHRDTFLANLIPLILICYGNPIIDMSIWQQRDKWPRHHTFRLHSPWDAPPWNRFICGSLACWRGYSQVFPPSSPCLWTKFRCEILFLEAKASRLSGLDILQHSCRRFEYLESGIAQKSHAIFHWPHSLVYDFQWNTSFRSKSLRSLFRCWQRQHTECVISSFPTRVSSNVTLMPTNSMMYFVIPLFFILSSWCHARRRNSPISGSPHYRNQCWPEYGIRCRDLITIGSLGCGAFLVV